MAGPESQRNVNQTFGEPGCFQVWNARDRVEGSFGALKNLNLTRWGRDYHHFVGLVRETLITAFAVIAYTTTFSAPGPPSRP